MKTIVKKLVEVIELTAYNEGMLQAEFNKSAKDDDAAFNLKQKLDALRKLNTKSKEALEYFLTLIDI